MCGVNIVHYLPEMRLGNGLVRAVLDLGAVMGSRGHSGTVLTRPGYDLSPEWTQHRATTPSVVGIGQGMQRGDFLSPADLRRAAGVIRQADVVHLHSVWSLGAAQLASLARRLGRPYVVSLHGVLDTWSLNCGRLKKRTYLALVGSRLLDGAAAVFCTASAELAQAAHWLRPDRAVVLPDLFDLSPFRRCPGPEMARRMFPGFGHGRPVLLFLSRLHPKKGAEVAIDVVSALRKQGIEVELIVAGSGAPQHGGSYEYVQTLRERVDAAGLQDRVHFVGLVVDPERLSLFQACDLALLPTHQENFGYTLVEALACGTPVITTRGVDIWEELERGGGTRVVDASTGALAEQMSRHVAELLSDRSILESMGAAGRAHVFSWLDESRIAAAYEETYAALRVSGQSPSAA